MNDLDERPVRFVCTDKGQHRQGSVATLRLTPTTIELVDNFSKNRVGSATAPEVLRLCCTRCPRDVLIAQQNLRRILVTLLAAFPAEPVVRVDFSQMPRSLYEGEGW